MKKILAIATIAVFSMTSCKKDRTCTCGVTFVSYTDNGQTQQVPAGTFTYSKKLTKVSKTGAHCNSYTQTDTSNEVDNGVSHTYIQVSKVDCKLE